MINACDQGLLGRQAMGTKAGLGSIEDTLWYLIVSGVNKRLSAEPR